MAVTFPLVLMFSLLTLSAAAPKVKNSSSGAKVLKIDLSTSPEGDMVNVTKDTIVKINCLSASELSSPNSPTIRWTKDGKEILDDQNFPQMEISRIMLIIHDTRPKDSGIYGCHVTNDLHPEVDVYRSVTLNVAKKNKPPKDERIDYEEEEPEIIMDKQLSCSRMMNSSNFNPDKPYICFDLDNPKYVMNHYFVKPAGTTLTLHCNAKGNPKPTVTWYKNGAPFTKFGYHDKILNNNLILKEITASHKADYSCLAKNSHSTIVYSVEVVVNEIVPRSPVINPIDNATLIIGDNLSRSCVVQHEDTMLLLQQFHRGREPKDNTTLIESRTSNETILADFHVLYLENVTFEDAGWYTCVVANTIGVTKLSFYMDVVDTFQEPEKIIKGLTNYEILIIISIILLVMTSLIVGGALLGKRYNLKRLKQKMQEEGVKGWKKIVVVDRVPAIGSEDGAILIPEVNIKTVPTCQANNQEYQLPTDEKWEFPKDRLLIGKYLGEGAFGEVCQATAHGILERGITSTVAVKTLKNTHSDADMIDLISEMETMKELGKHPNIINLLGCCTTEGHLFVIMEFAEHGSLLEFLRTNRHNYSYQRGMPKIIDLENTEDLLIKHMLTFRDLMSYAYQVARGMDYLSQRKYVHRDLAARNVLIAANHVAKICDFGMTRSTFANDYYRKKSDGRVPIKWMAPETLIHRVYTTQSDVWSYGILLWEIVTLGGSPYPTIPDMNYLLEFVRSGQRMSQPPNCPNELYILMRDCWMDAPTARPLFGDLVEDIGRILYIASETEYFELEGEEPPEEVITPPSSPENSAAGLIMFDPEFVKTFS